MSFRQTKYNNGPKWIPCGTIEYTYFGSLLFSSKYALRPAGHKIHFGKPITENVLNKI